MCDCGREGCASLLVPLLPYDLIRTNRINIQMSRVYARGWGKRDKKNPHPKRTFFFSLYVFTLTSYSSTP